MPSQAEKLWYIMVIDGKAKVFRNGISLKSSKGAEYGCLLDVSSAFPPHKYKERMIQVKRKTLFYFGMPRLWHKQQNRPICVNITILTQGAA